MSKICRWEYFTHLYSAYPYCAADSTLKARVWGWERWVAAALALMLFSYDDRRFSAAVAALKLINFQVLPRSTLPLHLEGILLFFPLHFSSFSFTKIYNLSFNDAGKIFFFATYKSNSHPPSPQSSSSLLSILNFPHTHKNFPIFFAHFEVA